MAIINYLIVVILLLTNFSDISLVFKKMECIGRYIKNEGQLSVDLKEEIRKILAQTVVVYTANLKENPIRNLPMKNL